MILLGWRPRTDTGLGVLYVSSDLASATSGAALRVDGGVVPTLIP
ncbi:hypothetical protein GCM10022226_47790 [Sphaerisporangium flaviroseum]|uniref:SDR family oxidoreductase n=1 Tax=Sphaerisporangium flaviroseum TaxID=509199 RepID=A0ABP7IM66_9ACTN